MKNVTPKKNTASTEIVETRPQSTQAERSIFVINNLQEFIANCEIASKRYAQAGMLATIKIGAELLQLKENSAHGEWGGMFKPNSNRGWNFGFGQETARKYITFHKKALKRLTPEEAAYLLALPANPEELTGDFETIISKATGEADSLRQAYITFGIIKPETKALGHNLDAGDRNTAGRPKKGDHLPALPEDDEAEREAEKKQQAINEMGELLALMETYYQDRLHTHLTPSKRDYFAARLRHYQEQLLAK